DETKPYLSLVHPMWKTHYGDYDHLARVKEWSLAGGEEEDRPFSSAPPAPSPIMCVASRSMPPIRKFPPSSRPMPARARPMCWRSARLICCYTAVVQAP